MRYLPFLLALGFAVHAAISTPFANQLRDSFGAEGDYRERRVRHALEGMDIEAIRARLDACLPSSESVALGPATLADGFLHQRLTEMLYPRRIDATARARIELVGRSQVDPTTMLWLESVWNDSAVVLIGACSADTSRPAVVADKLRLALPRLLLATASALGFGLFALWLVARLLRRELEPASAGVAGAVVIALLCTLATVLQWSLPWTPLRVLGLALGLIPLWGMRARGAEALRVLLGRLRREPEALLGAALPAALVVHLALWPVVGWDGRSVWLFHARRIFFHGMFARADLLHVDSQWSHQQYPTILPGWLAFFGADGTAFNERSAGISLALLLAGLLWLVWKVSREQLGRWVGFALTVGAFFSVQRLCALGYADGFLALLLLVQVLGLGSSRFRAEGWLAAIAASLLKQEGLVLAGAFALMHVALEALAAPSWRHRARAALPLLGFLPAWAYGRWLKTLGLASDYARLNWPELLADPLLRLETIFQAVPAAARVQPLLLAGLAGAFLTLAFLPGWLRRDPRGVALVSLAPVAAVAFTLTVFLLTPFELRWHLKTALDRVLIHASLLFVGAALRLTAPAGAASEEASVSTRLSPTSEARG